MKASTTTWVEQNCVIEFQGRKFESGGASVSPDYLIAYPGKDGVLTDWHGNRIGTYTVLSSRPAVFFGYRSWIGSQFYFMRANVNGSVYSLRGFGIGYVAKGKRIKRG